jgi:hypothetical protein
MSAPVVPGIYHVRFLKVCWNFFNHLEKRIDLAVTWLQSSNKRAERKTMEYLQKEGKFIFLSPDHYSQRSADNLTTYFPGYNIHI